MIVEVQEDVEQGLQGVHGVPARRAGLRRKPAV
jgi:hypothetical protein